MTKSAKPPALPAALTRALRSYGSMCLVAGADAEKAESAGLVGLLADIRVAAGDAEGRLMQDELLDRIRQQAGPTAPLDAERAKGVAQMLLPRPRKLWGVATDIDGAPALYTESDVLQCLAHAYQRGRLDGRRDDVQAMRAADAQKIHEEEAAWADHRRGMGPKPETN
ncbi:hypothetical protein H0A73_21660 [Alcaligenaceae bacterium]|nr:hypothetical protein [Alcaligenaceae bacterium]